MLAGGKRFHCFNAKSGSVGAANGLITTSGSAYSTIGSLAKRAATARAWDIVIGPSSATCEVLSLIARTPLTPTPAIFDSDRTYAPPWACANCDPVARIFTISAPTISSLTACAGAGRPNSAACLAVSLALDCASAAGKATLATATMALNPTAPKPIL